MEHRPFPPSARRLAEARLAGRVAWSPALVAGGAIAGGAIVLAAVSGAWVREAGLGITQGAASAQSAAPVDDALATRGADVIATVLALALPAVVVIAAVALAAHVAQTRSGWLPRRASRRLPPAHDDALRRGGLGALGLGRAIAVAAVAAGLLVPASSVLAAHAGAPAGVTGAFAGTLAITLLASAAATAITLGAIDWLERARRIRADLAMTAREVRDERRESEADPAWRRARARAARPTDDEAVRRATVVVVAGDRAAAVSWHARWQPVPLVTAAGSGRAGSRLAALARRHRVPVLHAPTLAPALVALGANAVIPERLHPDVARVLVSVT